MSCSDATLPDLGLLCCYGAAVYDHTRCTCWETVYDVEQQPPQQAPQQARSTMCSDCAFRRDSPERAGNPAFANSGEGDVDALAYDGPAFVCHGGMRRVLRLVHPSGAVLERPGHDYAPGYASGVPLKADGTPADLCAGYCAARAREEP